MFTIYRILNNVTGYCYIGCSKNLKSRWKEHKRDLQKEEHHNIHLQRAWNKYKEESFTWEVLLECKSEKLMFLKEKELIENTANLYNIAEGGLGGDYTKNWDEDRKEQHRVYCSNRNIERYKDPEERKKINCFKGLTQEERDQRLKVWSEAKVGDRNGRYKYNKPVLQIDRISGEVIKEWKDVCEASYAGFERRYVISCCKEKKGYNSHKGFIWKWKN
jgi:group I intron endonuclease